MKTGLKESVYAVVTKGGGKLYRGNWQVAPDSTDWHRKPKIPGITGGLRFPFDP